MTKRKSNIELLRIVCILLIISFHVVYKAGFTFTNVLTINKLIVKTFWLFGELGVNLFVLITGYFMINSKFKTKKVIILIFEILFYYLATSIFAHIIGYREISGIKNIFMLFFSTILNRYWFATAYILLYIFSPYLNILARNMSKIQYKKFLITALIIFSTIPTIFGSLYNNTEVLLYYNRFIWLTIIYMIGAYIKLYGISYINSRKKALGLSITTFILMVSSIILIEKYDAFFSKIGITEVAYLWTPNNIFMLILSISTFLFFESLNIKENKIINRISSTTFGIYLLHDGVLAYWFWKKIFKTGTYQNSPYLIIHILRITLTIFIIGIIIDLIRQLIEKYTLKKVLDIKAINIHTNNIIKKIESLLRKGDENAMSKKSKEKNFQLEKIMDKLVDNKIINWSITILLAFCFCLLSFFLLVKYEDKYIIITLITSFVLSIIYIRKTYEKNYQLSKENKIKSLITFILSIILAIAMHESKGVDNTYLTVLSIPIRIFRLRWWLLTVPAIFYAFIWLTNKIESIVKDIKKNMSKNDKKIYKYITIISSITIVILYTLNNDWYTQYDVVYSLDSGWVYKNMFSDLTYYDIRHPILGIFAFITYSIVNGVLKIFVPSQLITILVPSIIQIINIQCLLMIGFILKELSNNKWTLYLYLASAPTLLFALFFEKYQICTLLLVIYVYLFLKNKKEKELSLVLASGIMPTNILIYIKEFFSKDKIKNKVKNILKLVILGISIIICLGKVHILYPTNIEEELNEIREKFVQEDVSYKEAINSSIKMTEGTLLSISSKIEKKYEWKNILEDTSPIGIIIIIISCIGFVDKRKDKFTQLCGVWYITSFILIIGIKWSVFESPLFSIFYSWALVPLFQNGISLISKKMNLKEEKVLSTIVLILLIINGTNMINIFKFFN